MRKTMSAFVALAGLVLASQSFADGDDPNLDLIKARQGEMELRAYFIGPLVAMAKGEMEYDADLAAGLVSSLKLLTKLDRGMDRAWAPGTGNNNYPRKTAALPAIWTTYPEFAEHGKKYKTALEALASTAGNSLDDLRANLGSVGKTCKGCHDDFVQKK